MARLLTRNFCGWGQPPLQPYANQACSHYSVKAARLYAILQSAFTPQRVAAFASATIA